MRRTLRVACLEQIERKEIRGRAISIPAIAEENGFFVRPPALASFCGTSLAGYGSPRLPASSAARDQPDDVGGSLSAAPRAGGGRLFQSRLAQAL